MIVSKIRNLPGHYQKNFELRVNPGGRLFLYVPGGVSWDIVEGPRPLPAGRWSHVAATYDGARAQLHVDGVPEGAPLAVRYQQTATETFIGARPEDGGADGRRPSGPTFLFAGGIDDVQIWDRALTAEELQIVAGRVPPPAAAPIPPPAYGGPGPAPRVDAVLLARYGLDGDAREAVSGADGTLAGPRPAEDRGGAPRGALAFGGKDHVSLGVRTEPERFSLAVWVRPARAGREQVIFSKASTARGIREKHLELRLDGFGRLVLVVPNASPFAKSVATEQRVAPGRWTFVVATYDGETGALYLDGAPAAHARIDPFEGSRGPAFLGGRPDANGKRNRLSPSFDGRMDELRIYGGALTPADVGALARDDRPGPGGPHDRPGRDDDGGENEVLLVRIGRLLLGHDAACARGDAEALARTQAKLVSVLQAAEKGARGDRELTEQLRHVLGELQRYKGRTDAMSLDHVRGALTRLTEGLWNDLARELDDGAARAQPVPVRGRW